MQPWVVHKDIFNRADRLDKHTKGFTVYVDVKSPGLSDILGEILQGINTANLDADGPAIEHHLLYHYLDELREYQKKVCSQKAIFEDVMLHLDKLVQYLGETYVSMVEQLKLLLQSPKKSSRTFLWALLKPGTLVFATCTFPGLPVASGTIIEKKTIRGREIRETNGRNLVYDGEIFGEAMEIVQTESRIAGRGWTDLQFGGGTKALIIPAEYLYIHVLSIFELRPGHVNTNFRLDTDPVIHRGAESILVRAIPGRAVVVPGNRLIHKGRSKVPLTPRQPGRDNDGTGGHCWVGLGFLY